MDHTVNKYYQQTFPVPTSSASMAPVMRLLSKLTIKLLSLMEYPINLSIKNSAASIWWGCIRSHNLFSTWIVFNMPSLDGLFISERSRILWLFGEIEGFCITDGWRIVLLESIIVTSLIENPGD